MEQDTALRSRLSALQRESEHFYTRFVRISAAGIFMLGFAFAIVGVVTKVTIDIVIGAAAVVMCVGVFALTGRDGGGILGRRFFAYGIIGILRTGGARKSTPLTRCAARRFEEMNRESWRADHHEPQRQSRGAPRSGHGTTTQPAPTSPLLSGLRVLTDPR